MFVHRYQAYTSAHVWPSLLSSLKFSRSSPYHSCNSWFSWRNSGLAKSWNTRKSESGSNPGSAYHVFIDLMRINFSRGNRTRLDCVVMKVPRGVEPTYEWFVEQPHLLEYESCPWHSSFSHVTLPLRWTSLKAATKPSLLIVKRPGRSPLTRKHTGFSPLTFCHCGFDLARK